MALYSDDGRSFWRVGSRNNDIGTGNTITLFVGEDTNGSLTDTIRDDIVAAVRGVLDAAGGQDTWAQRTDAVITQL